MQTSVDPDLLAGAQGIRAFISPKTQPGPSSSGGGPVPLVTQDNLGPIARPRGGDDSFECLTYQLSMVL